MNMDCEKFLGLLSAFIDSELTPDEAEAAQAHVESCEACGREMYDLRQTRELLRSDSIRKKAPLQLRAKIMRRLGEDNKEARRGIVVTRGRKLFGLRRAYVFQGLAIAASLLLVLFLQINDTTSSPLRECIIEHKKCVEDGHQTYQCRTEHDFIKKVEGSLIMKPAVSSYTAPGFRFVCGDICRIKGINVSHMIMEKRNKLVSLFQSQTPLNGASFIKTEKFEDKLIKFGRLDDIDYGYWSHKDTYCLIVGELSEQEIKDVVWSIGKG